MRRSYIFGGGGATIIPAASAARRDRRGALVCTSIICKYINFLHRKITLITVNCSLLMTLPVVAIAPSTSVVDFVWLYDFVRLYVPVDMNAKISN